MIPSKVLKSTKGIIVWDFDRVLFDTERLYRGADKIFKKFGVPSEDLWAAVLKIRNGRDHFSIALVLKILRQSGYNLPAGKISRELNKHLIDTEYFSKSRDRVLQRLGKRGFLHIILSQSSPGHLYKKVDLGCGKNFRRHFAKICATSLPKHLFIKKISRRFDLPVFFVDDMEKHIDLVKEHLPKVKTLHYKKGWNLERVEKVVTSALKNESKNK